MPISQAEFLEVDGGKLAYEVAGSGPLVVLAHGIGDTRQSYRAVASGLRDAGHRVALVDLRGCGDSSAEWSDWGRTAIAGDLLALIHHLGGPAVLVGHSISGGAATIAAAKEPETITALVELGPFTRKQSFSPADLRVSRYRRGMRRMTGVAMLGSRRSWLAYLDLASPGQKPEGWGKRIDHIDAKLREPGRMKAVKGMARTSPSDAGEELPRVRVPVLVVMGTLDPDWADPEVEGTGIVEALPPGLGHLEMIDGVGHYPHVQVPEKVVSLVRSQAARA